MAGKRNAKSDSERELRHGTGATRERGKIIRERVLCASDAGAGNYIEKT